MDKLINRQKFIKMTGIAGLGLGLMGNKIFLSVSDDKQLGGSSVLDIDYQKLVRRADLVYNEPVSRSEAGLPIGNGRMGSLVWTTTDMLRFQINRVDVFGNNSASDNFYERNSDYCGGLGFVDIDFSDFDKQVFAKDHFKERLSCYNGVISVEGKGIKAWIVAWADKDVIAIEIQDRRIHSTTIDVNLRMLRSPVSERGDHTALSTIESQGDKIILTQKFTEDGYYCGSALVIGSSSRKIKVRKTSDREIQLSVAPGREDFTLFIGSAASFDPEEDVAASAIRQVDMATAEGFDGISQSTRQWWHNYWKKAFIRLGSDDGKANLIEKNYTYYLYVMASSSRGKYPTKFNGMLWTTGGDVRRWGSAYWGANQSCLYNALFSANRMELLDPMFNMYSSMIQSCSVAAEQQWGSKGIYIPETVAFNGILELPEGIAHEMQDLYLLRKPWEKRSEAFKDFASTKMPYLSRWNWKSGQGWKDGKWYFTDKEAGPFGHVTHIFSRGAKIAYQYWQKYEYTQDLEWLRNYAYPMLKGVAEFYRNFPNTKKEEDGKYHIYYVNDNESIWGGHNTTEEISAMKGIFPVAIKASEILNMDANMRLIWQEFVNNLSSLPTSLDYPSLSNENDGIIWVRALEPIIQGSGARHPDGNTMPAWFFDLCTLESTDSETMGIANATFDSYYPDGIDETTEVGVLSKLPVTGASLGRTEAARYLIPNQLKTAEIEALPNRMDLREGDQTTNVERLGRAAEALQKSLLQSVPPVPGGESVIHVFAAWPEDYDAQFTLLARGDFLVTSSIKNEKIEFVEILSQQGGNCKLRNPWPEDKITLYHGGKKQENMKGELLTFITRKDDNYVIVPEGYSPPGLST